MRNGRMKVTPALAADVDEHEDGQAERRQVGEHDARQQVERGHQAAQDERQHEADGEDGDRHDLAQVAVGDRAHVGQRGRLSRHAGRAGPDPLRDGGHRARMAGTASMALVVDGSPARRPASHWTVRPSVLT